MAMIKRDGGLMFSIKYCALLAAFGFADDPILLIIVWTVRH